MTLPLKVITAIAGLLCLAVIAAGYTAPHRAAKPDLRPHPCHPMFVCHQIPTKGNA